MTRTTIHAIRPAADADAAGLARLAEVDSQAPLHGEILLAEVRGIPIAAISLADGRTIGDPFRHTAVAREDLRARARALGAAVAGPTLGRRLRARLAPMRLSAVG